MKGKIDFEMFYCQFNVNPRNQLYILKYLTSSCALCDALANLNKKYEQISLIGSACVRRKRKRGWTMKRMEMERARPCHGVSTTSRETSTFIMPSAKELQTYAKHEQNICSLMSGHPMEKFVGWQMTHFRN